MRNFRVHLVVLLILKFSVLSALTTALDVSYQSYLEVRNDTIVGSDTVLVGTFSSLKGKGFKVSSFKIYYQNLLVSKRKMLNGNSYYEYRYQYDERNRLIATSLINSYNKDTSVVHYSYYGDSLIVGESVGDSSMLQSRMLVNGEGEIFAEMIYYNQRYLISKTLFSYVQCDNFRCTYVIRCDSIKNYRDTISLQFKRSSSEQVFHYSNGLVVQIISTEYDDQGRVRAIINCVPLETDIESAFTDVFLFEYNKSVKGVCYYEICTKTSSRSKRKVLYGQKKGGVT